VKFSNGTLHPHPSLIWRWTKGHTRPSPRYLAALSGVLRIEEAQLIAEIDAGIKRAKSESSEILGRRSPRSTLAGRLADETDLNDSDEIVDMIERRMLLKYMTAGLLSIPILEIAENVKGSSLSEGALESVGVMTEQLARSFDRYDYTELDRQIDFYLTFVIRYLKKHVTLRQRSELYLRGGQLAGLHGLSSFLQGDVNSAWVYYRAGRQLAGEVGHTPFIAWIIGEEASMANYSEQFEHASQLAETGLQRISNGAALANLGSNAVRAYSGMGDIRETERAIRFTEGAAYDIPAVENSDDPDGPIWGFSKSSALTRVSEGRLMLGQVQEALDAARHAVSATNSSTNERHASHAQLLLARSHAQAGQLEEACRLASAVLEKSPQDSHTIILRCNQLLRDLRRFAGIPEVREYQELIHHYSTSVKTIP
jgi:tetratricopeptide (TPR) repeat protein